MEKSNASTKSCSSIEKGLFFYDENESDDGVLSPKLKEKVLKQYEEAARKGCWFGN